ncbi:MAG: SulP family inorganic anion transporter [bacterium]
MSKYFPFLNWLFHYRKQDFKGDLSAGLTVAVMLIPQGMAVALLAGLPPIVGLYASVAPLFIYALFGTSRQMSVGPVAIISLLVASGIGRFAEPGSEQYILYATVLAGMVGLILFFMGLIRLGFIINFLSHPVISGFTSAAAVIIAFSQLKHLLGISIPHTLHVEKIISYSIQHIDAVNLPTILIGTGCILTLLVLRWWKSTFPRALIVVAASTASVWAFGLQVAGVNIMGEVPKGLHGFEIPQFAPATLTALFPIAVAIALVGFMESIAVAKNFAAKNHYEVDANQELIGLGLANIAASVFGAYPVTGGFSRSAVNAQSGARTGLASMITAVTIALTLLFLTQLFYFLPTATLAAIIIVAVVGLIDLKEVKHLYLVKRTDLISLVVTFFATLILGIEKGLILSIVASLILVTKRTTHPHCAILGRLPGTKIYRNIERYPEAITLNGLVILRIDASLYFANVSFLKDRFQEIIHNYNSNLKAIIFDASSVNDIDSSADTALQEIADSLRQRNISLYFTNVKGPVRDVMRNSGFYQKLGADHFFFSNHDAVLHFLDEKMDIKNELPGKAVKRKLISKLF